MPPLKDLTGKVFGRWTVLRRDTSIVGKHVHWVCLCQCGTIRAVNGNSLSRGISISCGCYKEECTSEAKLIDLTGKKFGRWTVLSRAENYPNGNTKWHCRCDCGAESEVDGYSLSAGRTTSCGCYSAEVTSALKKEDLTGKRFGRLLVIKQGPHTKSGVIRWECLCDCGNTSLVQASNLQSGNSYSCGCYARDAASEYMTTHGMSYTPTHKSWAGMKERCYNPNNNAYLHYGGRGIKVCDRWLESFENFLEDMGEVPNGMSLDRIDVNGDYTPENCRWATWTEQGRNKRNTVYLTYKGDRRPIGDWADLLGIPQKSLRASVKRFGDEEGIRRCLAKHGKTV